MTQRKLNTILYVEDEPDIREIAKFALENIGGFTVVTAASGNEALSTILTFQPDLILIDVMMPGIDGPTTIHTIRSMKERKHIPFIFMTAKIQPQEIEKYKVLGAEGVISKPFDPMTLHQEILRIWENKYGG